MQFASSLSFRLILRTPSFNVFFNNQLLTIAIQVKGTKVGNNMEDIIYSSQKYDI